MEEPPAINSIRSEEDRIEQALKDLGVLNPADTSSQPADRLITLITDPATSNAVLEALFPVEIPADSAFYSVLDEMWKWISVGPTSDKAVGYLWAKALQRLAPAQQEQVLAEFAEEQRYDLFILLDCLPVVLAQTTPSPSFLADWLPRLYKRFERDAAQGGFWNAVRAVCAKSATTALELLQVLLKSSTSEARQLAMELLGMIRGLALTQGELGEFARLDESLEASENIEDQKIWIWSWVATARMHGLTREQLERLLNFGRANAAHDSDSKLSAVCRLLLFEKPDEALIRRATQWASERINSTISRSGKYHVADTARVLQSTLKNSGLRDVRGVAPVAWSRWIVAIQPVETEDAGTWRCIESYLVELLAADKPLFFTVFSELAQENGDGIIEVMRQPHGFDWLIRQMSSAPVPELVGKLLLSRKASTRRLGLWLFDKLELETIDQKTVAECEERDVRLVFYEMQRSLLDPTTCARLFVSLLPRAEAIGGEFLSQFTDELELQVQNFPGGCRDELERLGGALSLVNKVLKDAESNFEKYRGALHSPIRAMQISGTGRAAQLHGRRMSRRISSSVEEHSIFLKMVKKVQVLYGQMTSSYFHGNLQNALPLVQYSSSCELPLMYYCDPEMMAMRRIRAVGAIKALEK